MLVPNGSEGQRISFTSTVPGKGIALPCGRCIGCRLERSRQWAVRMLHESKMHDESSFVTLTYDESHVPADNSLSLRDCQLFLKRLREKVGKFRYFLAGEYGEVCECCLKGKKACRCVGKRRFMLGRPHYHAIIFGYGFPDKKPLSLLSGSSRVSSSQILEDTWGKGFTTVGSVSSDSASYVAGYSVKKYTGKSAKDHYGHMRPEFAVMSRRPGIGRTWLESFSEDVLNGDEVIVKGVSCRPPRYYDKVHKDKFPARYESIRSKREAALSIPEEYNHRSGKKILVNPSFNAVRLRVKEQVTLSKTLLKSRHLEIA